MRGEKDDGGQAGEPAPKNSLPDEATRCQAKLRCQTRLRFGVVAPWVNSVVVIWGHFPDAFLEHEKVAYISGEKLPAWIETGSIQSRFR